MDKWQYQNKLCYLENRVVRELCKHRTACTYIFSFCQFDISAFSWKKKNHPNSPWWVVTIVPSSHGLKFRPDWNMRNHLTRAFTLYPQVAHVAKLSPKEPKVVMNSHLNVFTTPNNILYPVSKRWTLINRLVIFFLF